MISDGLLFFGAVVVLVVLVWFCIQGEREFSANLKTEYADCIAKHESEYTCKAYIQSMKAQHAAEWASAIAVGSAASSGARR